MLPKEKKTRELGFPERDSWLVFGAPKVGKTTFAAQWPECLILDLEDGTRYVEGAYVLRVTSLGELREAYAMLRAANPFPYRTVAIDTLDVLNDWIEQEVCRELGIMQMGEKAYGLDWGLARNRVLETMKAFHQLPANILWIAHSRWAVVGEVELGHTLNLPGKLARFVMAAVDNILFLTVRDGQRVIKFRPYQGLECGSRHPVLDRAGECPASYEALQALFTSDQTGQNRIKPDKTGQNKELQ